MDEAAHPARSEYRRSRIVIGFLYEQEEQSRLSREQVRNIVQTFNSVAIHKAGIEPGFEDGPDTAPIFRHANHSAVEKLRSINPELADELQKRMDGPPQAGRPGRGPSR